MRSEEEKTEDIVYYEKKSRARSYLESFEKKLRRSRIISVVLTAIAAAASIRPILAAYDSENTAAVIFAAAAIVIFAALVFIVSGAAMCRSLTAFFKWRSLRGEFRSAEETMSKLEEKFLDSTAFEPDVQNAENALLKVAEKILSFAQKSGL